MGIRETWKFNMATQPHLSLPATTLNLSGVKLPYWTPAWECAKWRMEVCDSKSVFHPKIRIEQVPMRNFERLN